MNAKMIMRIATAVIMVGMLSSCGNNTSKIGPKEQWLQQQPCAAPCWGNILPGKTTGEEAVQALKSNTSVDPTSISVQDNYGDTAIYWTFKSNTANWSGIAGYRGTDPKSPIIGISLKTPDLCLDEIIQVYGEPDYLFQQVFQVAGIVDLIWDADGFVYATELIEQQQTIEGSSTCGGRIIYFPVGTPHTQIVGLFAEDATEDMFVQWKGYGEHTK